MESNNRKPGAGKFASGNKFKGRNSGPYTNNKTSRNYNNDQEQGQPNRADRPDRPAREERTANFSGEGKKVFNRSERFNRNPDQTVNRPTGDRARPFEEKRASFKGAPKFSKPSPFKGNRRDAAGGEGNTNRTGFKSDRPERTEDGRPERPRYGAPRNKEVYSSRGERAGSTTDRKPYGEKPFRSDKPDRAEGNDRPKRFSREDEKPFNKRSVGERAPRNRNEDTGSEPRRKRGFERNPTDKPLAEAPNYDLKRYQARERKAGSEKKEGGLIRLNRYIANAGICSRREADTLIASGEIKVNGEVVTEMGYMVRPEDTVTYGKKRLNREKMVYVLLNKPKDFITTTEDPEGRKTVMDLVGNASKERIFPVGRLDRNTTGLLLFTNDGELAQKLTHPSNNISKIYQVELDKPITRDHFEMITNGLELEDGKAEVDDLAIIGDTNTFLGIQIHIGKNRIVRRIFEHLGYDVVSLDRVQYAGLTKKDLPRGNWRFLNEKEVIRLKYFL
ncbi:pseudouridine synthase [Adhaeribacter aquaticus]|uniref:pseudouridine synthase n=1 Tax=Adhaeribacter aquaticus TaxID=299567 RepID=UPI00040CC879|nr:pseudouridine synthase [Adhaeribacter aquaticus]